jgi:1-acyl-sn-glycerol-3-phosphate acyltransferase
MFHAGWLILAFVLLVVALLAGLALLLTRGPWLSRRFNLVWHLCRAYTHTWHRLKVRGVENIPASGPVILASNHTTGIDPLLLQSDTRRLIRWVMLTSWRFRVLEPLWQVIEPITLDRDAGDVSRIRAIVDHLRRGEMVGMFPEGGLQRDQRQLNPFHPGVAMIAKRSEAVIVPAWIEGTPRRRSMLLHFLQPSRCRVTFGAPYRPAPNWSRQQVLDDLRRRMEALAREG